MVSLLDPQGILAGGSTGSLNQQQLNDAIMQALQGQQRSGSNQSQRMQSPLQAIGQVLNSAADKFNLRKMMGQQQQLQQGQPDVVVPPSVSDQPTSQTAPIPNDPAVLPQQPQTAAPQQTSWNQAEQPEQPVNMSDLFGQGSSLFNNMG